MTSNNSSSDNNSNNNGTCVTCENNGDTKSINTDSTTVTARKLIERKLEQIERGAIFTYYLVFLEDNGHTTLAKQWQELYHTLVFENNNDDINEFFRQFTKNTILIKVEYFDRFYNSKYNTLPLWEPLDILLTKSNLLYCEYDDYKNPKQLCLSGDREFLSLHRDHIPHGISKKDFTSCLQYLDKRVDYNQLHPGVVRLSRSRYDIHCDIHELLREQPYCVERCPICEIKPQYLTTITR
jgi:hypothetical protein